MAYRSGPCAFCDEEARETCPRCGVSTCGAHGLADRSHCAICEKESKDTFDEIKFIRDLQKPGENRGMGTRMPWQRRSVFDGLGDAFGEWLDARRAKKTFARRTREQIVVWRRNAGIAVRGA
jgi:hypothetical protein